MAKKRLLFFFDIDGTIQSEEDGSIPVSAIESIKALREKGHMTFINTGRTAMIVDDKIRSIGFDGYVFGCGTEVILGTRKIFRKKTDPELCRVLANAVRSCNASPLYERSDAMFIDKDSRILPKMQELLDIYAKKGTHIQNISETDSFSFDKFVIWYDEKTDMSRFRRMIEGSFTYIDRGYGFAEMVPVGCSKAMGMKKILTETGADPGDTVAFGDSLNDAEMLRFAGKGIAMGGAKKLYPYADYVTRELKNHGIAFALRQNGWI